MLQCMVYGTKNKHTLSSLVSQNYTFTGEMFYLKRDTLLLFLPPLPQACYLRGLNPSSLTTSQCREWLLQWLQLSTQLTESETSLLLHNMVLLSVNYPSSWPEEQKHAAATRLYYIYSFALRRESLMEQQQLSSHFLGTERERMIQTGQLLPCGESMIQSMEDIDFYCMS